MSDYSAMTDQTLAAERKPLKKDADYVFYELTREHLPRVPEGYRRKDTSPG